MAFRLKLVPDDTKINFFRWQYLTFGISAAAMIASVVLLLTMGLNFGIDFKGGTTIRTESSTAFEVGEYRDALQGLGLEDVSITEVFDPTFGSEKHVAQVRIGAGEGTEAMTPEQIATVENALKQVDPNVTFAAVEFGRPESLGRADQDCGLCGAGGLGRDPVLYLVALRMAVCRGRRRGHRP